MGFNGLKVRSTSENRQRGETIGATIVSDFGGFNYDENTPVLEWIDAWTFENAPDFYTLSIDGGEALAVCPVYPSSKFELDTPD